MRASAHRSAVGRLMFLCALAAGIMSAPDVMGAESLRVVKSRVHSVEEVVDWLNTHLRYHNVSTWDDAPPLNQVVRDGYGDCKMLAGVAAALLRHVGVRNWIVTIKPDAYYHMFNVYEDPAGTLRIVNNARLVPEVFATWSQVYAHFHVTEPVITHSTYTAFRRWFHRVYWEVKAAWTSRAKTAVDYDAQ